MTHRANAVVLIRTTIGALLSAMGIGGIDRAMRLNVLAKLGKAGEVAGDVQTLILDKTGTINTGDREANDWSQGLSGSFATLIKAHEPATPSMRERRQSSKREFSWAKKM